MLGNFGGNNFEFEVIVSVTLWGKCGWHFCPAEVGSLAENLVESHSVNFILWIDKKLSVKGVLLLEEAFSVAPS